MAITSLRRSGSLPNLAYAEAGAVTQGGGAKTTTVVMSQMQGVITTDDANLATATEVIFTVTNTLVELTDTIALSIQSGGTAGEYFAQVVTVANGSFIIALTNLTGGTLGDAIIINFYVLRGDR
jgi:hypothetical protein